ncbi:MAG TPA: hypothetical protein DDW52_18545, partial [Planctomycetaceae bacterium]|nr:hypothetical protein [Planctomycetaceae bacterium]
MDSDNHALGSLPEVFPLVKGLELTAAGPLNRSEGLVEDVANRRFFRLGPAEFAFTRALMATSSATAALKRVSILHDDERLSSDAAVELCKWLAANQLVEGTVAPKTSKAIAPWMSKAFFW